MTILETAQAAFADHMEQGIDAKIAAANLPIAGTLSEMQAQIDALSQQVAAIVPGQSEQQVDAQIAAALDGVRHLMFSEE